MHFVAIEATIPLAVIIVAGWLSGRFNIINKEHRTSFSNFVINFSSPSLLFIATATSDVSILFNVRVFFAFLCSLLGMYLLSYLFYRKTFKYNVSESSQCAFVCGLPDMAFIGIPLLASIWGAESVVTVAIGNVIMSVFIIPITISLLEKSTIKSNAYSFQKHLKLLLSKPLVVAPILGAVVAVLQLPIPDVIKKTLELLGHTTAGVSLFTLGLIIASFKIKLSSTIWINIALKNIIHPMLALITVILFKVPSHFAAEIVLLCSLPSAVLGPIFAMKYNVLSEETVSSVILGTLTSFITVTIILYLLSTFNLFTGRDYALVNYSPNKISALKFISQQALCILPATLSFEE